MEYYLFASNNCNLGCRYCSVLRKDSKEIPINPIFSVHELLNFIKIVQIQEDEKNVDIVFFGGEPTLNYPYIYHIIDSLKSINHIYNIRFFLHTNGLLLHEIDTDYLDNFYQIILSINYEMIDKENLNNLYFSRILKNIAYVKSKSNIRILGRLTITEKTSLYTNVLQVCDFFDSIYWQIENKSCFDNYNEFYKNYLFELNILWNHWFGLYKKGILLNMIPFTHYLNYLKGNNSTSSPLCGYNIDAIYIRNDGKCFSCPEEMENDNFSIGHVKKGKLHFMRNEQYTMCSNCISFPICRGRCGRMHKSFTPDQRLNYCKLNKIMFSLFENNKESLKKILMNKKSYENIISNTCFSITECIP
jgi:radical SAM protein with 4Fe4S-binding SPASM domain